MQNSTQCCNAIEALENLKDVKKLLAPYKVKRDLMQNNIKVYEQDAKLLNERKQIIESAKQYYLKVVDLCYMQSIAEMEDFVNHVLGYVFYDEEYSVRLDITNRYNKSITFYFYDAKKELETPLRKGNGKGVKAVTSFILLTHYLLQMGCKYVFLDESFVNISKGYITRFFEYVKLLCNKYDMCVVLITHDTCFPEFADIIYNVKKGKVTRQV